MPKTVENIIFFTIDFPPHPGGMSRHCLEAVNVLSRQGYRVAVITAGGGQEYPGTEGIEIIRVPGTSYETIFDNYLSSVWSFAKAGMRYCRSHRVRACFANTWTIAGAAALLVKILCAVPYIVFAHGLDILSALPHAKAVWLMRRVFGNSRAIIANSLFTRNLIAAHAPAGRVTVIHPAVEQSRLKGQAGIDPRLAGKRFILTVARLVESKGIDTVISGLPAVLQAVGDIRYCIVGSGPQEEKLRKLAQDLGVGERVIFAGQVPDQALGAYYAACEFFIMVSRQVPERGEVEGFGIVFLEAALFAKPSIASRCGGIPDAVIDGQTGILVDPDDPRQTAAAAVRLLSDRDLCSRLGSQARGRAEKEFNIKLLQERLDEIVQRGISGQA
jgi:phosphatidylinositol alpha-1,6-mannosyltransferase